MKVLLPLSIVFLCFLSHAQNDYIDYEKDEKWMYRLEEMAGSERNEAISFNADKFVKITSSITISYHSSIGNNIERYLSYQWFPKVMGLLEYYRPLFEEKLSEYGLPKELCLLPIVESNLNPQAQSPVGAEGLWQFMPATGKQYGLAKNQSVNLFFDPYMSTDAACRFLSYLYKELQDWNLVLSAYNCGLGRIRQAIRKAGTTDYWEVRKYLPPETQAYVPTFHAVRYLYNNYSMYYQTKPVLKYSFLNTKEITTNVATTFRAMSKKMGINLQTLYFLNPHLTSESIPKNSFVYLLN